MLLLEGHFCLCSATLIGSVVTEGGICRVATAGLRCLPPGYQDSGWTSCILQSRQGNPCLVQETQATALRTDPSRVSAL